MAKTHIELLTECKTLLLQMANSYCDAGLCEGSKLDRDGAERLAADIDALLVRPVVDDINKAVANGDSR